MPRTLGLAEVPLFLHSLRCVVTLGTREDPVGLGRFDNVVPLVGWYGMLSLRARRRCQAVMSWGPAPPHPPLAVLRRTVAWFRRPPALAVLHPRSFHSNFTIRSL